MHPLVTIVLFSWLAGVASFVGGLIAVLDCSRESEMKQQVVHGIVAFGGGILVSAVAFALVPAGMAALSPALLGVTFVLGGCGFCWLDLILSRQGGSKSQFLAMLMDFLPEALSLGAVFASDSKLGILLAIFIGAQNLPEGFNSFREVVAAGAHPRGVLKVLLAVSLLGPVAACAGYWFLQDHPAVTAGIMCFAAGGILYLIFQDIAPASTMPRHWSPPLGAVLGFAVGMIGKQLIG